MDLSDSSNRPGESLSQSEVEQLIQQVQEQKHAASVVGPHGRRINCKPETILPFDFRQPAFLAAGELRKLRVHHEEFIRSLAARLAIYLRIEFSLQMSRLQTGSYQKFTESVGNPTHLTLFKAEPLKGVCLLDIPPRLGLAIVDRMMGGEANVTSEPRDLTEIETALLDQVVQVILNEWCNSWHRFHDLRPVLLGHETNGRFLQTAPHDTTMFCLGMEARVGDCTEQMQFAFTHYTMEPLVRQLANIDIDDLQTTVAPAPKVVRWNPELNEVPVGVTAEWSGLEMTARELASLKPGDVIMLDPHLTQAVNVSIASTPKYLARLGTQGKAWAVELMNPVGN